jgi:acyl-homoserine-lactone acylase
MSRIAALAASALAALLLLSTTTATAAAPRYDVTIARTQFGIPHIKAKDFASLGYGYAYALAQDNICTVAESYITSRGERARFFGPDKGYAIRGNGSTANNLNSDFFYQRVRDRGDVERLVAVPPPIGPKPDIKQALQGYVAGYNAWLRDVGGSRHVPDATCRGKAWVRPITIMDVYRRFYSLAVLASQGVAIDGVAAAQPPTPPAGPSTRAAADADVMAAMSAVAPGEIDRRLGGLGSNAYAIGRESSQDGHGLLYGNPHFPWQGPERFYQTHLTIPGRLDVTGGSLMGVPIVLIGTTKGMAWSHTVSTARRFAPYQLTLVPGSPTSYVEDGVVKRMTADRVTVQVPAADGTLQPRTRTLYSSEHGPIFTSILGLPLFPWSPATAYVMYDANAENFGRLMNHFFDMNAAQSVDDVERILKTYQGIPWVNTIAADTAGNAYYADIGSVPNVDQAKYAACQTAVGQVTDAAQRIPVLDGSRGACAPGTAADAVAPGILGLKDLPSLRRADHVSNMNDSYWLTNPLAPLEGFSRIIGDERTARSLRTRLGIKQLEQRRDGTDGLAGKGFTLANLMTVGLGNRVYSGEIWRDDLVAGCASAACDVLRAWDLRNDLDSRGAILWQRFVTRLTGASPLPLPGPAGPYAGAFDVRDPVNTPAGLNTTNPTVTTALQQAVADLQGAGLALDATPRQGQTVTRRGEVIPIHGGPGGSGIFNVITPTWNPKRGYTEVVHGSSFVQAVHLKPGCPDIRTLLTYGESEDPGSVHTSDLTKEFSAKRWVKVPFCAAALERDRSAARTRTADLGTTVVTVREARGTARPQITVVRTAGKAARITVRIRRGDRVVRRITRRGARVSLSPRVARGAYRVDVSFGTRTVRLAAAQR